MEDQNFINKQSVDTKLLVIEKALKELGGAPEDSVNNELKERCRSIKALLDLTKNVNSLGKKPKIGSFLEVVINGSLNIPSIMLAGGSFLLFDDTKTLKFPNEFSHGS